MIGCVESCFVARLLLLYESRAVRYDLATKPAPREPSPILQRMHTKTTRFGYHHRVDDGFAF